MIEMHLLNLMFLIMSSNSLNNEKIQIRNHVWLSNNKIRDALATSFSKTIIQNKHFSIVFMTLRLTNLVLKTNQHAF